MSDLLKRMRAEHKPPSNELNEAIALLKSSASMTEKSEGLERLARQAPAHEREQFGDLATSLILQQELNNGR